MLVCILTRELSPPLMFLLQPLCLGRFPILLRKGVESAELSSRDIFVFNTSLPSQRPAPPRRFGIPAHANHTIRATTAATTANVSMERKFKVDAAIVRIMKARKRLHANELVAEVVQQLQKQFQPDAKLVKRCIESLLEREYLDRDADDQNVFIYQA